MRDSDVLELKNSSAKELASIFAQERSVIKTLIIGPNITIDWPFLKLLKAFLQNNKSQLVKVSVDENCSLALLNIFPLIHVLHPWVEFDCMHFAKAPWAADLWVYRGDLSKEGIQVKCDLDVAENCYDHALKVHPLSVNAIKQKAYLYIIKASDLKYKYFERKAYQGAALQLFAKAFLYGDKEASNPLELYSQGCIVKTVERVKCPEKETDAKEAKVLYEDKIFYSSFKFVNQQMEEAEGNFADKEFEKAAECYKKAKYDVALYVGITYLARKDYQQAWEKLQLQGKGSTDHDKLHHYGVACLAYQKNEVDGFYQLLKASGGYSRSREVLNNAYRQYQSIFLRDMDSKVMGEFVATLQTRINSMQTAFPMAKKSFNTALLKMLRKSADIIQSELQGLLAQQESFSELLCDLGVLYLFVDKNYKEAVKYFFAAGKFNPFARYFLALCQWQGLGTQYSPSSKKHIIAMIDHGFIPPEATIEFDGKHYGLPEELRDIYNASLFLDDMRQILMEMQANQSEFTLMKLAYLTEYDGLPQKILDACFRVFNDSLLENFDEAIIIPFNLSIYSYITRLEIKKVNIAKAILGFIDAAEDDEDEAAQEQLQRILTRHNSPDLLWSIGKILVACKNEDLAEQFFERARTKASAYHKLRFFTVQDAKQISDLGSSANFAKVSI